MGQLDFLLGTSVSAPRLAPPPPSKGFSLPSPTASGSQKGIPETFNVNKIFGDVVGSGSKQAASLFGTLGQLPARVYETPVSIADVAAKRALGFSPVDAIGKTPVGAAAGFLGEAVNRASSLAPAVLNSEDAAIWGAVGGLPDNTVITHDLLNSKGVASSALFGGAQTGGIPVLANILQWVGLGTGPGGRDKTVGELRTELANRGFFTDPSNGTPINPTELAAAIQSGQKSSFDFGNRATNSNALVDMAARVALDPTNLLFFVPGANIAKLGSTVGKVFSVGKLVRAGELAAKAPRAVMAAEAITQGNRASATLAGMARVFNGYRKLAIGTAVGNFALNRLTSVLPQDTLPFQSEINDFTKAVENRQPMSGNAAFMLFSAATFPYGNYVKGAVEAQRGIRAKVFGVGDMAPLHDLFGGTAKFREEFGGRAGERQVADFLTKQIVRDEKRITPAEFANIQSIGDVALRRRIEQQALERIAGQMRAKGEITGDMLAAKWLEFDAKQAGFESKGISNPFDPARSAKRWRDFEPVRQAVDPILRDTGEAIWGLRDDVVFTEQVTAARDVLKNARTVDAQGKTRVPVSAILDVLTDHPNINSLDTKGFWSRFGAPDAKAPSWDSISRRLTKLERDSTKISDYTAELAVWEKSAPADITPVTMVPRAQRISELQAAEPWRDKPQAKYSELVPVSYLRELSPGNPVDAAHVASLAKDIRANGMQEPIVISYAEDTRSIVMDEGNHRLAAAVEAGLTEVPVTFVTLGKHGSRYRPLAKKVPGIAPDEHGYVPSNLRPSDIGVPTVESAVGKEISGLLAEDNGIHWAKVAEQDAKTGADPAVGRAINEAVDGNDFLRPVRLSPGLDQLPQAEVQRVVALEKELVKINPSYRMKRAPKKEVLALVPEDGAIATALRQHTALGEWLHQAGPFSPVSKFWHGLTRPVKGDELAVGTKNALMAELVPLGVKPRQVEGLLQTLEQRVKDSIMLKAPGGFTVRSLRDIGSIMPGEVNQIAGRYLPKQAVAAIEKQGGFYRLLARTGSRYWRSIDSKARAGNKGAAALQDIYRVWTETPGLSGLATVQRSVAKYYYPLFRFALDPRWIALNVMDSGILMSSKHGVLRGYKNLGEASPAARYFTSGVDAETAATFSSETGWSLGRETNMIAAKAFDAASPKSVVKVIDEFGKQDPAISALRSSLVREAQDSIAKLDRQFQAGEIPERTYLAEHSKADKQLKAGSESLALHLNDTLYRYEKKGVDATVIEEARAILNSDELRVMQPLIDKVVDVNRKTWDDIQLMLHGNPARSTMERLANSYWAFWPISYQIKATKWLADIMLNGSFGHNNNALLAGKYSLWVDQHKELMLNNPQYAAMYAAQPTLWFLAQMILPMGPEDIGVSLSKPASIAGTVGQRFLNSWLGTQIGAFTADKYLDDPSTAISWLTNMGPMYSIDLASRIFNEMPAGPIQPGASLPSIQPIPSTAGGQTPVVVR